MKDRITFFAAFALAGALVGGLSFALQEAPSVGRTVGEASARETERARTLSPFEALALSAHAAFVVDGATGEALFEKNADAQLPLASLTKVMNALTALSIAPRFSLVPLTPELLETEGDSGLTSEERWTLEKILSFSLAASSNDGAAAVAAAAGNFFTPSAVAVDATRSFVEAMNREAEERGLSSVYFLNATGLDETSALAGGYGSARDVSRFMLAALHAHPEIFAASAAAVTHFTEEGGNGHTAENTNKIIADIPLLRASKTGFTDIAGGNLSVVFDVGVGKPVSITVLGATEEGRFDDVRKLIAATLQFLQKENPL